MKRSTGAVFVFLMFIIIASSASIVAAIEIGISPGEITFNAKPMEIICKQITVYSSSNIMLTGEDRWAESAKVTRNMNDYKYKAESLGLSVSYPKDVRRNNTEIKICVGGIKDGTYQGALVYSTGTTAGVGTWLIVNVGDVTKIENENKNQEPEKNKPAPITGNVIWNIDEKTVVIPMLFSTIILFFVLIFLIRTNKKLNREKEESREV